MKAYAEDLAYIHDVGFSDFARGSAPGLLQILRQRSIEQGRVVDLGCGSGVWARTLVDAGHSVLGIDLSREMIRRSRQRVPEAVFRQASLWKTEIPDCDAVTSIGECLNYQFDSGRLVTLFRRVYRALRDGGVFIFDVLEPARQATSRRGFSSGHDWAVLAHAEAGPGSERLVRRIVTFRKRGRLYRRGEETHTLRLMRGADLAADLRGLGFRVQRIRGYGSFRFGPSHAGVVARKPARR